MRKFILIREIFLSMLFFGFFSPGIYAGEIMAWEDCLVETKKNNPELISAVESVNQQKAAKNITASGFYPQINSSLAISRTKTTAVNTATGNKTTTVQDSHSYGVSGSQLLFDGFKTFHDVKSAGESIKASQESYRFTSSGVRFNLRTAFINLLKAQELVRVAEEIVKIRRDNLGLITLRYQSGLEHKGALLTAETNVAEANFELSQAKRDVELAQRQLTKEMGRTEFKPFSVKGDFTIKDEVRERPDFDMIVRNNPSLLEAAAKKNAASFNVKSAYADFSPQVSADIGADTYGTGWPPGDKRWNAGLSVTMPVFEGGLRFAQVSQAQAAYRQAAADEKNIKAGVIFELAQTWKVLQDSLEIVDVRRKALDAAVERSRIAEAQYSTGFITFDNWIIIEDNLVTAKKAFLSAQANVLLTEADWIQAKGETLEYAA